jgi:hypothetical protein
VRPTGFLRSVQKSHAAITKSKTSAAGKANLNINRPSMLFWGDVLFYHGAEQDGADLIIGPNCHKSQDACYFSQQIPFKFLPGAEKIGAG